MKKYFLIYVHLERCGGTTMHNLLRSNFPFYTTINPRRWSNELQNAFTDKHLKSMLKIIPFCQGIGGHTIRPFFNYESVLKPGYKKLMFTFLRDPVKRYLSHFYYQKYVMNIPWSIEQFLDEERFNHFQTVKIAGSSDANKAIEILQNKIDFVGISEQYDASLLMLFALFGKRPNYELRNALRPKGEVKKLEEFPEKIQNRILENNSQDQIIYDFAIRKIFPSYLDSYSGNLESDIIKLKKENEHYRYAPGNRMANIAFKYINYKLIQPLIY